MGLNLVWSIGRKPLPPVVLPPVVIPEPEPEPEPVMLAIHDVADNTGRAGELQQDNPVLEHISQYRPYDRTRILRKEKGALYVHFPVGKADLRHDFSNNAATLDRIVDITRQVMADTTSTVKKIQLIGLASIEGTVAGNEQLAANRALALQRYLQQQVNTPNALYETVGGGEAWADLRDILNEETAKSEKAAAAQAALDIIDSEPNADLRERKLRQLNGGRPWQYISKELLPQLRNSGYIRIYYDYVPDSAAAVINRASELLRTDCEDCHREALALLQQVSTDERAQNALGVAYYLCHRPDDALRCFRRAAANGNEDARRNVREMEKNLRIEKLKNEVPDRHTEL
jgi:outer membrane protein OmpA-like peptidoglycan-associated protein